MICMSKRHADYYKLKSLPCYHNKGDLADFSQFAYVYQNIFNTAVYLSNNKKQLVTDEGIQPSTYSLGNYCSMQLS